MAMVKATANSMRPTAVALPLALVVMAMFLCLPRAPLAAEPRPDLDGAGLPAPLLQYLETGRAQMSGEEGRSSQRHEALPDVADLPGQAQRALEQPEPHAADYAMPAVKVTQPSVLERIYRQRYDSELSASLLQFGYEFFSSLPDLRRPEAPAGPGYILGPGDVLGVRITGTALDRGRGRDPAGDVSVRRAVGRDRRSGRAHGPCGGCPAAPAGKDGSARDPRSQGQRGRCIN